MAWKLDEQGNFVAENGNPVWVADDGSEAPFDAKANIIAAATAKREAAESRKAKKELEEKMAAYEGIEDPAAALKALQFAQSMEGKKVMDDEAIQKLITNAVKPLQSENEQLKADNGKVVASFHEALVGEKILASEFLKKTTYSPADAKAIYGRNFRVEDGKVVPYDQTGNPIYSTAKAGEYASVDEALQVFIDSRPDKDILYRATGASGAGTPPNGGGAVLNSNNRLANIQNPVERLTAARAAGMTT